MNFGGVVSKNRKKVSCYQFKFYPLIIMKELNSTGQPVTYNTFTNIYHLIF